MATTESMDVRELSTQEQAAIDGGVQEGGCVSPILQQMIDALNGTTSQP
jgi:hypothetical protein